MNTVTKIAEAMLGKFVKSEQVAAQTGCVVSSCGYHIGCAITQPDKGAYLRKWNCSGGYTYGECVSFWTCYF